MTFHQNELGNFILGPIVKGTIVGFLTVIFLTIGLGMITNAGWQGMLHWSSGAYLMLVYLSLIIGSLCAGFYSCNSGWVVGMGVGLLISFLFLINALLSGEGIKWLFFIFKTFIHCFIGAFGGIIGINITKK
jgi:putative membrane protein (TIGR04086 family)